MTAAPSARLDHARKVLEETNGDENYATWEELVIDRAKLRAALEAMVAWAEEMATPARPSRPHQSRRTGVSAPCSRRPASGWRSAGSVIVGVLSEATEVVNAGEAAKLRRAAWVKLADAQGWTQQRIAAAAGISQPAVSKILKDRPDDDLAYQVGRLLGLAAWVADKKGHAYPYADKILGGGAPVTQITIQRVHREITTRAGQVLPVAGRAARAAYEEINAWIGELGGVPTTGAVLVGVEQQARIILGYHHQRKALTDANA